MFLNIYEQNKQLSTLMCIFVLLHFSKPLEQTKYVEMFNSLGPVAGKLPGTKVKPVKSGCGCCYADDLHPAPNV